MKMTKTNKIAIIGDLHIGVRNSSKIHHAYMESVLIDFFKMVEESGIKTVIQLGDLFDDRKSLNLWAWNFFDTVIQPKIEELGIQFYVLAGNHDSHYRDTLEINTPGLMLKDHPNVTVVDKPTEFLFGTEKFLLVPWINKENLNEVMNLVETTDAQYCCGHFEFNGFDLYKGNPAKSHFTHLAFNKFKRVYSGHYHTFSTKDNVVYTGTPYELTWQDCNDDKCYVIHQNSTYEKVLTLKTLYVKLKYNPAVIPPKSSIENKIVRIVVDKRPDKIEFNKYIHEIEKLDPHDLKVQEIYIDELSEEKATVDITKTRDIIMEYLDNSNIDLDKEKIMSIFDDLYNQAIHEID